MPKGFYYLILAQFSSGLADNAFMILGVFFLQEQGYSGWWAPLLKFAFTLSYVVLASVAGCVAIRRLASAAGVLRGSARRFWAGIMKSAMNSAKPTPPKWR